MYLIDLLSLLVYFIIIYNLQDRIWHFTQSVILGDLILWTFWHFGSPVLETKDFFFYSSIECHSRCLWFLDTLLHMMACCLFSVSHYLIQCWHVVNWTNSFSSDNTLVSYLYQTYSPLITLWESLISNSFSSDNTLRSYWYQAHSPMITLWGVVDIKLILLW